MQKKNLFFPILAVLLIVAVIGGVVSCANSNTDFEETFSSFVESIIDTNLGSSDSSSGIIESESSDIENDVVDFSKLTYVALGDSITYGFDSTRGGLQMENPYPDLVREELNLRAVYNYGISGSTLTNIDSTRYPMTDRSINMTNNGDIVSVMGGINDYMIGKAPLGTIDDSDASTIYGALNVLASGLKEKYPNSYIFFMTPYKWRGDTGTNAQGYSLEDLCTAIKEVCAKYDIDVLDMYESGLFELEMNNSGSDGCHPSQSFFEEYTAPMIADFIRSNYK